MRTATLQGEGSCAVHSSRRSLVISLLALFVALSSGAYAATGGNFILGETNTATSKTALTAKLGAPALQITNNAAKLGATALALNTAAGHPPLTTTSTTTAPNLSADLLDGIDSSGFVQGSNTQSLTERKVTVPGNIVTLFTIPGFGVVSGLCSSNVAEVDFQNTSGVTIDAWLTDPNGTGTEGLPLENGESLPVMGFHAGTSPSLGVLSLGVGNDPGPRSAAFLHGYAYQSTDNAPCGFQAEASVWHS